MTANETPDIWGGLVLDRPLAVLDIESTGVNRQQDRIIDLAIVKVGRDGAVLEEREWRFNPGRPIPPAATAIHGIKDQDVQDKPTFVEKSKEVAVMLEGCDIGGYNVLGFDIPMLQAEFTRADVAFNMDGRRVFDAQRIFFRHQPRTLSDAIRYYCQDDHDAAHSALGDVKAVIRVMQAQMQKDSTLPRHMDGLGALCNPQDPDRVDASGRLKWVGKEVVINFGKYTGCSLKDMVVKEPGFLKWIMRSDFPQDTRDIVTNAMGGKYPTK